MVDSPEPECDSLSSASTTSSFDLPDYLLHALTPVRKATKKNSCYKERRSKIVEDRTKRLKDRSNMIKSKLERLKKDQEVLTRGFSKKLSDNLKSAKERKVVHLEERKRRARQVQVSALSCLFIRSNDVFESGSEGRCLYSRSQIEKEKTQKVIILQRGIRLFLLKKNIKFLKDFNFSEKIWKWSYPQALKFLRPDAILPKIMLTILRCLRLPDVSATSNYKCFFYSLILLADIRTSLYLHIPLGFNSNTCKAETNNFTNSIAILLIKLASSLTYSFILLLYCDPKQLADQFSPERINFSKRWRIYHFIFQIFKEVHFQNCKFLLEEAIRISDQELHLLEEEDVHLTNQRGEYGTCLDFFVKMNPAQSSRSDNWLYFGMLKMQFLSSISEYCLNKKVPSQPFIRVDQNALSEMFLDRCLSSDRLILYERLNYNVPPNISIFTWRQYWINYYCKGGSFPLRGNQNHPMSMQTGLFRLASSEVGYIDDSHRAARLELYGDSLDQKYETKLNENNFLVYLKSLDEIAREIFLMVFHYCLCFEHADRSKAQEITLTEFKTLTRSYQITGKSTELEICQYFKFHFCCLRNLVVIEPLALAYVPARCSEFIGLLSMSNQIRRGNFDDFFSFYRELELACCSLWVWRCRFTSVYNFKIFENVCQYASQKNLRIENGTNSAHLRFPIFYEFLSLEDPALGLSLNNYKATIDAFFEYPDLTDFSYNGRSYLYFRLVYFSYLFRPQKEGCFLSFHSGCHEFSVFFSKHLANIKRRHREVIMSTAIFHLVLNYFFFGSDSGNLDNFDITSLNTSKLAQEIFRNEEKQSRFDSIVSVLESCAGCKLANSTLKSFYRYFFFEYDKLCSKEESSLIKLVLEDKFYFIATNNFNSSYSTDSILRSNFRNYSCVVKGLISDSETVMQKIYDLYCPLLNWIYKDIGEPLRVL